MGHGKSELNGPGHGPCIYEYFQRSEYEYRLGREGLWQISGSLWDCILREMSSITQCMEAEMSWAACSYILCISTCQGNMTYSPRHYLSGIWAFRVSSKTKPKLVFPFWTASLPPASAVEVIQSVPSVCVCVYVCLCVSYHSHNWTDWDTSLK